MCKNFRIAFFIAAAAALAGCGQVGDGSSSDTEPLFTTTTTITKRTVHTTKTAVYIGGEVDVDDEGLDGGYTTTTTVTGSLKNSELYSSDDDEVDEEIRSTQRTDAKTFYTIPEHNGTTAAAVTVSEEKTTTTKNGTISLEGGSTSPVTVTTTTTKATTTKTTTTAAAGSTLFKMEDSMRYKSQKSFTVVSDTTYLNLRYGPSKQYDIRLQIPNGAEISGWGETVGTDGNDWVYTSYNGTVGWVMKDLLEE